MGNRKNGGLGKGLSSLLGEDFADEPSLKEGLHDLEVVKIRPNQQQPRKKFDEASLQELADSIRQHGVITPITVRPLEEEGCYQIIAGERRWRAARSLGLLTIPAKVIRADEQATMEMALIENLQRQDLGPMEEADGYHALMDEYGLTQEEVAKRVGKSRSAVANSLRLLGLVPEVRQLVQEGKLSGSHARAILAAGDQQLAAAQAVMEKEMSVRQAESYVKRLKKQEEASETKPDIPPQVLQKTAELEGALGRKVTLSIKRGKGQLSLAFYSDEDLERLLRSLKKLNL
jgi:ParB family chromosome partitioning protein